ncbi:hypothetical protein Pcinc_028909 [Petrolisthes cinctipes]|uniref:cystathionine gamma-lyase n=1 Tax=Petrolisthes cinctipes TaxID=88211 RepID=A0AAE1F1Z5_PETCI|nr:hypothetical protein Pcinc_028909 [Petrolisthes cinctipes]
MSRRLAEDLGYMKNDSGFFSKAVHEGVSSSKWSHRALVPPVVTSTLFDLSSDEDYFYSRIKNPTRSCLQEALAATENAKFGVVVSSGQAASSLVVHLLKTGDHIVAMDDICAGTNTVFRVIAQRMGIEIDFVDMRDLSYVRKLLKSNTKLVWIESPSNPTMKVIDIRALADMVKQHEGILLAIDNTFMSPYFQRPLDLGADIVMHSMSKYINGHSDVVMGGVVTNREDVYNRLDSLFTTLGPVPSAFDCYLVLRSLKTLPVRMEQHMMTGLEVARFLEGHPCVEKVLHPGLPSHPQHQLSKSQSFGHSGMFSFYIKGNDLETAKNFLKKLKVFTQATSLGGPESLCVHPATITHQQLPLEERERYGITAGLIRVSCGLETPAHLTADLDQALRAAVPY